jgi:hypothetical protein
LLSEEYAILGLFYPTFWASSKEFRTLSTWMIVSVSLAAGGVAKHLLPQIGFEYED